MRCYSVPVHDLCTSKYGIKDVYFDDDGNVISWTDDFLSDEFMSYESLYLNLKLLEERGDENFKLGELQYEYAKFDLLQWLHCCENKFLVVIDSINDEVKYICFDESKYFNIAYLK
jgi:hypothetical protein